MKSDSVQPSGTLPVPESVIDISPTRLSRRTRIGLGLGLLFASVLFLFAVHDQLYPFVWAAVVAYVCNPIVVIMRRRLHMRRGVAVGALMTILLLLLVWIVASVAPLLQADALALSGSFNVLSTYVSSYVPGNGTQVVLGVPIQFAQIIHSIESAINGLPRLLFGDGLSIARKVLSSLLQFLTFTISTFYLLLDGPRLGRWLLDKFPSAGREEARTLSGRIGVVLSDYLRAEVTLIVIMTIASFIALSILSVRFAVLLAPIVGFVEIFPIVGPFFGIGLVTIVALVSPPPSTISLSHTGYAILVAVVFFVMRQIEDYVVIPNVVGHAVKLHPVLILFALLTGSSMAGILGMFLAVPVTGALQILIGYMYERIVE